MTMTTQRQQSLSMSQDSTAIDSQCKQKDSNHASSAFSPSANPNEDWTKISDLAERRRIQNRIAQRNYRKKLKRRLEDLERKAASTSSSPEQEHIELPESRPRKCSRSNSNIKGLPRQPSPSSSSYSHEQQTSPDLFAVDDQFSTMHSMPDFTLIQQPTYPFSSFQTHPDYFLGDPSFPMYQQMPLQSYYDGQYSQAYAHGLAPTLPTMMSAGHVKQESFVADDELLSPFSMNFASLAGLEPQAMQNYNEYSSRTPSLTDSNASSGSRHNSPVQFTLPMTPISRSTSPNVRPFDQIW